MSKFNIAVIGLGYVGLPLAYHLSKKYSVTGIDLKKTRIQELKNYYDSTDEISSEKLKEIDFNDIPNKIGLSLSSSYNDILNCNIYIVTVPTPVDINKNPDLTPLSNASKQIGQILSFGDIVIYESTVYPGATEEICVPQLEKYSGLSFNKDFFVGYSPERINPGDKINTLTTIKKVVSGSNKKCQKIVQELYNSIIKNGTHLAPSIKVAEASKVIENAQRDLNISFMNELALIFDKMEIDTKDVIDAASTKWNFLKFQPGLVGGHCISVDPYYLAHKAKSLGYSPDVIYSGRKVNEFIPTFIAEKSIRLFNEKENKDPKSALILGATFKENCSDIRNSRVFDIKNRLEAAQIDVSIFDSYASVDEVKMEYGVNLIDSFENLNKSYDIIILAVSHKQFLEKKFIEFLTFSNSIIFDVKGFLPKEIINSRL
tara:strand:+ start:11250 stop:12539 length:1290 start_codon:yes stop_codon:yes gene_type:complete